jgi:asparagine synthetase B (glutamine-hydrolysing)
MCGITGFWNISIEMSTDKLQAIAQQMSDTLLHRGPDSGGIWVDEAAGIALGHRRLGNCRLVARRTSTDAVCRWTLRDRV